MDYRQNPHLAELSMPEREQAVRQAIRARKTTLKASVWGSLAIAAIMLVTIIVERIH